jgi:hypothetical protein
MGAYVMEKVRHDTASDGCRLPRYRAAMARLIAGVDDDLRLLVGQETSEVSLLPEAIPAARQRAASAAAWSRSKAAAVFPPTAPS